MPAPGPVRTRGESDQINGVVNAVHAIKSDPAVSATILSVANGEIGGNVMVAELTEHASPMVAETVIVPVAVVAIAVLFMLNAAAITTRVVSLLFTAFLLSSIGRALIADFHIWADRTTEAVFDSRS
jgi:hypothetical protein